MPAPAIPTAMRDKKPRPRRSRPPCARTVTDCGPLLLPGERAGWQQAIRAAGCHGSFSLHRDPSVDRNVSSNREPSDSRTNDSIFSSGSVVPLRRTALGHLRTALIRRST
jgi:hypothetical protein